MEFKLTGPRLFVLWAVVLLTANFTLAHTNAWWLTGIWFLVPIAVQIVAFPRHVRQGMTQAETTERALRGQCLHCGYDLRASVDRCPECGAATKRAA